MVSKKNRELLRLGFDGSLCCKVYFFLFIFYMAYAQF